MTSVDLIAAFNVPSSALVHQRVPKKLLVENGAPTAADKRKINEGIEELSWIAALKPTTIGVPEFRDEARQYLEIAILYVVLRAAAATGRLSALIHRAVPYPVLLVAAQGDGLTVSLAHKRRSQGKAEATVLDGILVAAELGALRDAHVGGAFLTEMAISRQPHTDLFALYQGWLNTVVALLAAQVTGVFAVASSPEMAAARRAALAKCETLKAQLAGLRAAAAKERQVPRQVKLNLETQRLQTELSAVLTKL